MKKIALLTMLTISSFSLFSQGVRMGLTGSPQISWLKSDAGNVGTDGTQFGFSFGLLSDFFFAERYSFSSGIMINNTGGKLKYNDSLSFKTNDKAYDLLPGATIKYKIQYIDIPMAFRMESNQIGYFLYYTQFGLTNHIRVGTSADIDALYDADNTDGELISEPLSLSGVGCKDEVNIYNLGYNIGAGFNYYFSKNTALTFGLLYTSGFIDVTNNEGKNTDDKVSLKSITFKFGVLF